MANPYRTEAISLVRSCWPEATRPVGEMKFCYCGGKMTAPSQHDRGHCRRDDCPRARLGYGSWHVALSKLWNVASSSSGGNPVKLEPVVLDSDGADEDGAGYDSEFTVLASDESGASIFGLRSALHEVEEDDELSDSSSQGDGEMAVAEKERVSKWRTDNLLLDSLDFAYVFTDLEDAYSYAGRAVAVSWSRARVLAEPEMVTDMAKVSAVEATATKIRKVDEQRKTRHQAIKKKKMIDASFLRQPGKGTEVEEEEEDKVRFTEPLAQLMMDCGVGRTENASATDEEIMNSLRRKATRVVKAAEIPTLHRAVTTADELRKYLDSRATHMGVDKVEPIVLEEFLWQSRARDRAFNAICWMCKKLQLGWPTDSLAPRREAHAWYRIDSIAQVGTPSRYR